MNCMTCGLGGKGREDLIRFSADMIFLGVRLRACPGLPFFFFKGCVEDVDLMSQEYIVFAFWDALNMFLSLSLIASIDVGMSDEKPQYLLTRPCMKSQEDELDVSILHKKRKTKRRQVSFLKEHTRRC